MHEEERKRACVCMYVCLKVHSRRTMLNTFSAMCVCVSRERAREKEKEKEPMYARGQQYAHVCVRVCASVCVGVCVCVLWCVSVYVRACGKIYSKRTFCKIFLERDCVCRCGKCVCRCAKCVCT